LFKCAHTASSYSKLVCFEFANRVAIFKPTRVDKAAEATGYNRACIDALNILNILILTLDMMYNFLTFTRLISELILYYYM
jgi:hypothetical protein